MDQINEVFSQCQDNPSNHQKLIQSLKLIYKNGNFQEVSRSIVACVDVTFREDYKVRKERLSRIISFIGQFLLELLTENSDEEVENPLVRAIINRVLLHIDTADVNCRFHATELLEYLLKHISTDIKVSSQLCDDMQDHLVERFLLDMVLPIRILSGSALIKLQDIGNPRCPVMQSYISMCSDGSPAIRKQAVEQLALTPLSHETLIRLMRDTDMRVRLQAYKRVSTINPKYLKITQRQQVMMNGIEEEQLSIRKVFLNKLIPAWLEIYANNLLSFYNCVRLDAEWNDIKETRIIHEELMDIYFMAFPAKEILNHIPIGNDILVPVHQLTSEISAYWYYLVTNVQKRKECDIELEMVLPQLTPLCEYIRSVLKAKQGKQFEDWQYMQFQEILYNLFRMVSVSDLADEVGRKHLQPLIRETIINTKLEKFVIEELLQVYKKFIIDTRHQCEEICCIMSEIRESTHDNNEDAVEMFNKTQKAELLELNAKVSTLEVAVDKAIEEQKFIEAGKLNAEIRKIKKKIDEINTKLPDSEPVRDVKFDPETVCRCLDILSTFLKITRIQQLPSSLRVCLNEFVKPGAQIEDNNVHERIFLVLGQFSTLDKELAEENTHYLCSPLVATKFGKCDAMSIIASLQALSDVIRTHGPDILGDDDDWLSVSSTNSFYNKGQRRKLYQEYPKEDIVAQCMNVTIGLVMEIVLDLLDEEDDDVRHTATIALMKLVMNGLLVNSSLLTRLLLKWLNPLLEKHDSEMQQIIGSGLLKYAMNVKNSTLIIHRAIIPTLNQIGNAPDNSPFQDVDLDNVLLCLCNLTRIQHIETSDSQNILALDIIRVIQNRPKAKSCYLLAKMLVTLERSNHTSEHLIPKCIEEVDLAIQYLADTKVIKVLQTYKTLLNNVLANNNATSQGQVTAQEDSANGTTNGIMNLNREELYQNNILTNKENENPDEEHNSSCSSNSTLINSIINNSQHSVQSTSSERKSAKKTKRDPSLQVIIERSGEIDRLCAGSTSRELSQDSTSSGEVLQSGKRRRGRPKNTANVNLSQGSNISSTPTLTQSTTNSTRSSNSNSASIVRSRKTRSTTKTQNSQQDFFSKSAHKMATRSARKPQKHRLDFSPGSSSDENTPRGKGERK